MKGSEDVMEILEAYDLLESIEGAAAATSDPPSTTATTTTQEIPDERIRCP